MEITKNGNYFEKYYVLLSKQYIAKQKILSEQTNIKLA